VPAGGALAVDRDGFSEAVTAALEAHPLITIERGRDRRPAAGGLGQGHRRDRPPDLAGARGRHPRLTGADALAFFDAIAPIVHFDSIDMDICWFQSRYDKVGPGGTGKDYINCPMTKEQYEAFIEALIAGREDRVQGMGRHALFRRLPADRGHGRARPRDAAHGPMKPVGLTNRTTRR
jgi:methylenetetrahydrofolate--tRNA-(uracil-5-)-methyltransferase